MEGKAAPDGLGLHLPVGLVAAGPAHGSDRENCCARAARAAPPSNVMNRCEPHFLGRANELARWLVTTTREDA
jgi:hypothetical protein